MSATRRLPKRSRNQRRQLRMENLEDRRMLATLFSDSFEQGEWNGLWVEDSQNDWFRSTQRAIIGSHSAEVDGRATNATLAMANPLDLTGYGNAQLSFSWFIEKNWDSGESIAADLYDGSTWNEVASLRGNVDPENTWRSVAIPIGDNYLNDQFKVRFRANVNGSKEDGFVDNVQIVGTPGGAQLAIHDMQWAEGNSGTGDLVFTVTRTGDTSATSSVAWSTADGTATWGSDYVANSGTIDFLADETSKTITILTIGDTSLEGDETLYVDLTNPSPGTVINDAHGVGTIVADDGADVPAGLVSWWTADGTTADLLARNDATLVGGTLYSTGEVDQAFSFDGTDDRVQLPDSDSLKLTKSLSVEGWVSIDSYPTEGTHGLILFRGDDRGGLDPYFMNAQSDGTVKFQVTSFNGSASVSAPVAVNQLVHLAGTLDDATGTMRLYVDGSLAAETVTGVRPFGDLDSNANPGIGIGNHGGSPTTPHNFPFDGLIDELSVYGRALTGAEVLAISDAGVEGKLRMAVASTSPGTGEVVTTSPTSVVVEFMSPYLPASIDAFDLTVNGIPANSVTLIDGNTVTFEFGSSPVTSQGLQLIEIGRGAVLRASDGLSLAGYQASFRYDVLPMEVVATDPSPGSSLVVDQLESATTAVVSLAGMDGQNGGWPLLYGTNPVSNGALQLIIDEDQLLDTERSHTNEQVGFIAFDANPSGDVAPFLRTGSVSGVTNAGWTTVTLDHTYSSMVVVATPSYDNTSVPLVARIQQANGSSFQLKLDRADGLSATVPGVNVHYVVVEEGVYTEGTHGVNMEAVRYTSTVTDHASSWTGESRSYANNYESPVVLGQVMTANDPAFSAFWARGAERGFAPSSSALYTGKHVGEDPDTTRSNETIGYIVIDGGKGTIGGTGYLAGVGADIVTGVDDGPALTYNLNVTSLQVDVNEPFDNNSVGTSDLSLSSGAVMTANAIDADSIKYTMVSVNPQLTVEMAAGALTDTFGNPMLPFSVGYGPPPQPNDLYVYDIRFDSKRGGKDWRVVVEIRSDSNANGQADGADQVRAGATVSVDFAGQTFTGQTDSNGVFRGDWMRNLSSGDYYANVWDLALNDYIWNKLLGEDDSDDDNFNSGNNPDDLLQI